MTKPFLSICAIVRNEGPYIFEWLSHHRALGFSRFTLYLHDCEDNTREEIQRFPYPVDVIDWPGEAPQIPAYKHMLEKRSHTAEWCAFIDVDEFLFPKLGKTLMGNTHLQAELQNLSPEVTSLHLPWRFFGSSGHRSFQDYPVTQRFLWRGFENFGPHSLGKSLVRLSAPLQVLSPHKIRTKEDDFLLQDSFLLAHYFCKSAEEWVKRRALGRPALPKNHPDSLRSDSQFASHDVNNVYDLRVAQVLSPSFTKDPSDA